MVIGRFKYENSFNAAGKGLIVIGQVVSGMVRPGSYLRFKEDDAYKDAEIIRVEHGNRNDYAFVGLPLAPIANDYFDSENEELVGKVFDIIE